MTTTEKIRKATDQELVEAAWEIERILEAGAGTDTFLARLETTYTEIVAECERRTS